MTDDVITDAIYEALADLDIDPDDALCAETVETVTDLVCDSLSPNAPTLDRSRVIDLATQIVSMPSF